jgi:hypothetical protein
LIPGASVGDYDISTPILKPARTECINPNFDVAVDVPNTELMEKVSKVFADLDNHATADYVGLSTALIPGIRQGDVRRSIDQVNMGKWHRICSSTLPGNTVSNQMLSFSGSSGWYCNVAMSELCALGGLFGDFSTISSLSTISLSISQGLA